MGRNLPSEDSERGQSLFGRHAASANHEFSGPLEVVVIERDVEVRLADPAVVGYVDLPPASRAIRLKFGPVVHACDVRGGCWRVANSRDQASKSAICGRETDDLSTGRRPLKILSERASEIGAISRY